LVKDEQLELKYEHGKGNIWDIVYNVKDLETTINNLLKYREENKIEIEKVQSAISILEQEVN
jgi:hypothetical protein